MERIRIVGSGLVAVFALCTVAASGASATEVLFKLAKGNFPATFKSHNETGGELKLETVAGIKVECTGETNSGEIENAHLGKVTITFTGCTSKNVSCNTIELKEVWFHLGLADPGDLPAILLLLPGAEEKSEKGGELKFKCGTPPLFGSEITVTGDVIGALDAKVGEQQSETKLAFEQNKGKQKFTEFLLSLTTPENELMTGQHLTTSAKGAVEFGPEESGQQAPKIVLNEYKNSAGEATKIELVDG